MKDRTGQHADFLFIGRYLAVEVQGRQRSAMKATVEGDDRRAAGGATHDLQGIFGRFRTAVGEHAAEGITDRYELRELLHEADVRVMRRGVEAIVGQLCRLILNGRDHLRVAMPQIEHPDAADEVDVAFAGGVPDFSVAAVGQRDVVDKRNGFADVFAHRSGPDSG